MVFGLNLLPESICPSTERCNRCKYKTAIDTGCVVYIIQENCNQQSKPIASRNPETIPVLTLSVPCFVNPNNSTRTILTQTGVLAGIWQYSKEGDIMAVRSLWWTSFFFKTLSPCRQEYILCPNSSVSTLNKSIENNVNPCIWILEEEFLSLSGSSCVQIMGISK